VRIIFVSHNIFGINCLDEIIHRKGNVIAIFTVDDSSSMKISDYTSFERIAEENNILLYKIKKLSESDLLQIRNLKPDIIFVIGWSQLIPNELLNVPDKGCIGMHPTLLPRGRGRAPINWALIKGMEKTGLTMFYLSEGADTGDIIGQEEIQIALEDDAASLYEKVIVSGRHLISEFLPKLENEKAPRIKQDGKLATVWPKRNPDDGLIDWNKSPMEIYNWIRGLTHPYPGAFTFLRNKKVFILSSKYINKKVCAEPGTIIKISEDGLVVSAWEKGLLLTKIQPENKEIMSAMEFAEVYNIKVGDRFQNRFRILLEGQE